MDCTVCFIFLLTIAGPQILGLTNKRFMESLFYSCSLSSCSCTKKEFVQLDPLHWLQAGEHSKLCLRYEHRMVPYPDLKLHLTMCRRLSGAGGNSLITGNIYLTVFHPPSPLFHVNLFPSPLKDLGVHTVKVELCCSRTWREAFCIYLCNICSQLFLVALHDTEENQGFVLACYWIGEQASFNKLQGNRSFV